MVLDGTTVPGCKDGEMRYVDFPILDENPDEQTASPWAGNTLFMPWWASERHHLDRSE